MADPIAEAYVKISADLSEMEKSFENVEVAVKNTASKIEADTNRAIESINSAAKASSTSTTGALEQISTDSQSYYNTMLEKAREAWDSSTLSASTSVTSVQGLMTEQQTSVAFAAAASEEAMAEAWLASLENTSNFTTKADSLFGEFTLSTAAKLGALAGTIAATFATKVLVDFFAESARQYEESEQSLLRLEASLLATGNQTGFTKDEIISMGKSLSELTGFSEETITAVQTIIATFAGVSGKNFEDTTKVVMDMTALFGGDAESNAMLLARALSEPDSAAQKLEKSVYKLTDAQKESIQQFIDVGDKAGAAGVILDSFKSKVDDAAERTNSGLTGALRSANSAWQDFQKVVGEVISNTITPIITSFANWAKTLDENNTLVEKLKSTISFITTVLTLFLESILAVNTAIDLAMVPMKALEDFISNTLGKAITWLREKFDELSNSTGLSKLSSWFTSASEQVGKLTSDFKEYASTSDSQFIKVANSAIDNYNAIENVSKAIKDAMVSDSKEAKDAINKLRDEELAHAKQVEEDKQKAAAAANAERINSTKSSLQEIILNEWDYLSTMGTISDSLVNDVYKWAAQQGVEWEKTSIDEKKSLISAFLTEQYNMENSTLTKIHDAKVTAAEKDKALQESLGKSLYDIEQASLKDRKDSIKENNNDIELAYIDSATRIREAELQMYSDIQSAAEETAQKQIDLQIAQTQAYEAEVQARYTYESNTLNAMVAAYIAYLNYIVDMAKIKSDEYIAQIQASSDNYSAWLTYQTDKTANMINEVTANANASLSEATASLTDAITSVVSSFANLFKSESGRADLKSLLGESGLSSVLSAAMGGSSSTSSFDWSAYSGSTSISSSSSSSVSAFADGGIVSQPTLFGFGNGQTGVMGEAGTEVIMPIARNSQGEMGVKVADSGGMGTYVVNLMMDGAVLASQMFKMSKTGELKLSPRSIVDSNMAGI